MNCTGLILGPPWIMGNNGLRVRGHWFRGLKYRPAAADALECVDKIMLRSIKAKQ